MITNESNIAQSILSDITVYQKYAKFIPELNRRETWDEIVDRNMAMHIRKFPDLKFEIKQVYNNYVRPKKVLASMRSFQFAGTPIEINNSRVFNCGYMTMDHPFAFAELMFLLLGGTGIGYSVQKRHIEKLPEILGPTERRRRFLIGDSIEGWAESIKVLIKAYTQGKSDPAFDFRDIRKKGARLVTSGGKAPGPDPLRICLDQVRSVLNGAIGRKLSSLEVHDINCYIADAVLAGGIRRAAMIALFDKDDLDMLSCKSGAWYELNPQRGRANNSVVLNRETTTEEEFFSIWKRVEESGSGEPGFYWTNNEDWGANPCWTYDSQLLTDGGYEDIGSLVGKPVNIWNGQQWSKVTPFSTGVNEIVEVHLTDGSVMKCTPYHKFLTVEGFDNDTQIRVEAKDLVPGTKLQKWDMPDGEVEDRFVEQVVWTGRKEETFCVTEPLLNQMTVNGVVTGNCVEIALRPNQFCVAGDTKLITRQGIEQIDEVVGKEIEIWNGEKWSTVRPYQTGTSDRLHRVYFSDGSFLDATDNHKFLIKTRFQKDFHEIETVDLIEELKTTKYALQIPRSNISYEDDGENRLNVAYDYGFVLGDGHVNKKNIITAHLFNDDKTLNFLNSRPSGNELSNVNGTKFKTVVFDLDVSFTKKLKYDDGLPTELFTWNRDSILQFIAGWADADGSLANNGIRIYGREDKIRDGQLLLSKVGINSSVNLLQKKGIWTNLGERKNDVWYLQIVQAGYIPTQRLMCENVEPTKYKGKHQTVRAIETLEGLHPSYCLTEDDKHQCVFNNVLTKQCNLTEVNVSDIEDQRDYDNRVRAASFIGTLQAAYTDFHYLRPIWEENSKKDALIGVSMTGIASGAVYEMDMTHAAEVVKEENERVANLIGINKAARCTCTKPAGTTSLVLGTSSGVHAWHNEYYIRRMRVGKNEALYAYMKENFPTLVEDCHFKPHLEAVMSFPQKAPEGAITRNESVLGFLKRVKKINTDWVFPGHRDGDNKHNVSCTVSIKNNEWEKVGQWMWKNRDSYTGISVLPYDNHCYVQAPFEDCTKETYEEMLKLLKSIDLIKVKEIDDSVNHTQESLACAGGSCEI